MDPNSGHILTDDELAELRIKDPEAAAKFTVRLDGPPEHIALIGRAVAGKAKRRAKSKAARAARKVARR